MSATQLQKLSTRANNPRAKKNWDAVDGGMIRNGFDDSPRPFCHVGDWERRAACLTHKTRGAHHEANCERAHFLLWPFVAPLIRMRWRQPSLDENLIHSEIGQNDETQKETRSIANKRRLPTTIWPEGNLYGGPANSRIYSAAFAFWWKLDRGAAIGSFADGAPFIWAPLRDVVIRGAAIKNWPILRRIGR